MESQYYLDLARFSLARFMQVLQTGPLLPSERILGEEIDERFVVLESMGIETLKDLTAALSTKKKRERFSQESGLPQDYLTVLRRRAGGYTPRPIPVHKLLGINPEHVEQLAVLGIKDTKQLFDRAWQKQDRAELAEQARVPEDVMLELVKLSDLARPPYVGPVFARLLYEAGLDTVAVLSKEQPEALRETLLSTKQEKGIYKAAIPSAKDFTTWLQAVRELPQVLEV